MNASHSPLSSGPAPATSQPAPAAHGAPAAIGLYDPVNEHDSCGVGFVAHIKGKKSHRIIEQGLQTASGVPLMCDEPADFRTFRVGLFGLDKWADVDRSVGQLAAALDRLGVCAPEKVAATA